MGNVRSSTYRTFRIFVPFSEDVSVSACSLPLLWWWLGNYLCRVEFQLFEELALVLHQNGHVNMDLIEFQHVCLECFEFGISLRRVGEEE